MEEPRYAIFEPLAPRTTRAPPSRSAATLPGARLKGLLTADRAPASSPTAPATVSFVGAVDAERARREGRQPLRVPRMPIRVIPQAATDGAEESGAPWGIAAVGADRSVFTGAGVCVAVLDTGVDADHPAFAGLINSKNYQDFTGTGLTDAIGHGTHCAGIIFGRDLVRPNLEPLRIGVARGVTSVLVAKIADRGTITSTETLEKALLWAVEGGADVISMSVGLDFLGHAKKLQAEGIPQDAAIALALSDYRDYARFFDNLMGRVVSAGAAGRSALVVAAAGNDSHADGAPSYRVGATLPAVAEGVLSVGAIGRGESGGLVMAPFSNSGANVCAPGVGILSAVPGGGKGAMSGTSQAAPHAAGVAALWWEKIRRETSARPPPSDVMSRMRGTANFAAVQPPAEAEVVGQGLVVAP